MDRVERESKSGRNIGFVLMCLFVPCILLAAALGEVWDRAVVLAVIGSILFVIGLVVMIANRDRNEEQQ